jgi:hypothetical protein
MTILDMPWYRTKIQSSRRIFRVSARHTAGAKRSAFKFKRLGTPLLQTISHFNILRPAGGSRQAGDPGDIPVSDGAQIY